MQSIPEFAHEEWDAICESMDDRNMVYHIGNAGRNMEPDVMDYYSDYESDDGYRKLNNLVYFLDFDQADHHLSKIERRIKFDRICADTVLAQCSMQHLECQVLFRKITH